MVDSPYGEVGILVAGILYLFAEIAYSGRIRSETVDQVLRIMTKAEPKLRFVFSYIITSESHLLPLVCKTKNLKQMYHPYSLSTVKSPSRYGSWFRWERGEARGESNDQDETGMV